MNSAWIVRRAISCIKPQTPRKTVNTASAITVFGVRKFSAGTVSNMKFVQFSYKNNPNEIRVGYLDDNNVVDLNKAIPDLPTTLLEILRKGEVEKILSICKCASNPVKEPMSSVLLKAPITGMDKVLCIGLNYKDHCEEQNLTPPEVPMIFSKFASTVIGQSDAVRLRTDVTNQVDYEVEFVVVIGKTASNVKAADAYDYVLGFTVAQDVSARDWQAKNGGQVLLGKTMDTFCPIGPCITTTDEIGDPENLAIKCSLNGVLKQSSRTDQLVHKIPDVIERLTSVMTLYPGDIILTGTPGGVGMYRSPPEYLKPGDVIHSEIENIGTLETHKVDWEVELAVVIGKTASNVKSASAYDYVLGYTVAQDISARDWQKAKNGGQFLLGKSMDTFCPIGPCIATTDEIGDPQKLAIKCTINGDVKQTSRTDQLVHKIPDVIERLSSVMTLYPGDIILTGTPGGVGMYRSPPEYLKPGDVIHSEIENIGTLETRVEKF